MSRTNNDNSKENANNAENPKANICNALCH